MQSGYVGENILKFTPLEFETKNANKNKKAVKQLKFTPLEFETRRYESYPRRHQTLNFTSLEFEAKPSQNYLNCEKSVKIYFVGV